MTFVTTSAAGSPAVPATTAEIPPPRLGVVVKLLVLFAALAVLAMMVWQGIAVRGSPDPTAANISPTVAALDIAVLVFREGLECILVIAAITASMTGARRACRVHRDSNHVDDCHPHHELARGQCFRT